MAKTSKVRSANKSSRKSVIEPLEARIAASADVGVVLGAYLHPGSEHVVSDDVTFAQHFTADHGLTVDSHGAIVFEDGLVVTGDLVLPHATSVIFKGSATISGNVVIDASSEIVVGANFAAGGSVSLTADEVDFVGGSDSAKIGGDVHLQSHTPGRAIEVGFTADKAGTLGVTDSDLAALHAAGRLTIGDTASSGVVTIDSAEFHNAVTLDGSSVSVQHGILAPGFSVTLEASGIVRNDGVIDVSAHGLGQAAGQVLLTGQSVGNFGSILSQGSATTAGGSVKMISTSQTLVSSAGRIDVSGGTNGGTVYLWSDTNTTMSGQILARGSKTGGHGGYVEVSSAGGFSLTGVVDTTAAAGQTGMLLLDPKNVIIANTGTGLATDADQFSKTPSQDVTISATTLNAAATAVTIQANNDITIDAVLNMSQDLTLQAGRSVLIHHNVTLANHTLSITANDAGGLDAQRDAGAGYLSTDEGVILTTGNGTINLTVDNGDAGAAGGMILDKVVTTGTLNIKTAGFVHETNNDAAPSSSSMTSDDDLTAGVLNFTMTATDATVGEAIGQGNGALEIAAGVVNAHVLLPNSAPATDFVGYFVLADANHTSTPLTVGDFNAGGGSVSLTARGSSILSAVGSSPNIVATQVNLTTESFAGPDLDGNNAPVVHYGSIGTAGAPIRTDIVALTATSVDGGLFISEANTVLINKIVVQDKGVSPQTGAGGAVVIQPTGQNAVAGTSNAVISAGGDIVLLSATVANQFTLSAGGMILDGNQNDPNVLARTLTLQAGGDIGNASDTLETSVMNVQATTLDGGVFLSETDAINVTSITAGGTGHQILLSSGAGAITLGALTAVGGDVTVKSAFDAIVDGNGSSVNVTAATTDLEARTTLGLASDTLEVNVSGLTTKVTNGGGGTFVSNSGTTTALSIETNSGPVNIGLTGGSVSFVQPGTANQLSLSAPTITTFAFSNTGGSVAINNIDAGTGSVSITAKTSINDYANDTVLNLKAGTANLHAGTSIGTSTNAIETKTASLTATADAGGIYLDDAGTITSLSATAKGAGNDIAISSVGDMTVAKVVAPHNVTLHAGGDLLRSGSVLNVSGAGVDLQAGGSIGTSAAPLLISATTLSAAKAATGSIYLQAKGALAATLVQATAGTVNFTAEGNLTLGLVEANATQPVNVTSTYGSIIDGNGAAVNIRGGAANLTASAIGTSAKALDTDIVSLNALGTSGGVFISEANDLNVTRIEAQGLGSNIALTTGGNMVLSVAKADGDKVSLQSLGGSISDGNGAALNISADTLDITAPLGVSSLQNAVNKLGTASGGAAGVVISNIGALAITEDTLEHRGASKLTIQADSITILDIADDVATLDPNGSIQLTATTGNVIFLDPKDTIATSGTGSIGISAGLGRTPAYPDTGAVAVIGNLTTTGGNITVVANHHITIGLLNAGSGNVTVASETGLILDGNGSAANIIGNNVILSGAAQSARQSVLETSIRIADYSATRSEAAAKLTDAQSLSAATAIMNVQQSNALLAKNNAIATLGEAESAKDDADRDALIAYIAATVADGVSTALGITRDIVAIPAGVAQAIPFTGDGGAMGGYSALDVAANVADAAAFALGIVSDHFGDIAEEAANDLVKAGAEETALSATFDDSLHTYQAFNEATSIAQKAADAAAIARDHALVVRDQAVAAEDQVNVIGLAGHGLQIQANHIDATANGGSVYLDVTGGSSLGSVSATGTDSVISVGATGTLTVAGTIKAASQISLQASGSILDGGGLINAPKFLGQADGSVGTVANPLHTQITTAALVANTGTVGLTNDGAFEIGTIAGVHGLTAGGNVGLTGTGSLTLKDAISAPGQAVTLLSSNGAIIDNHTGTDLTASSLNATAATGMEFDSSISSLTASVTGAGSVTVRNDIGLTLASVQTANGGLSIQAGGTIVANSVVSHTDSDANDILLKTTGGHIQAGTINAGTAGDVSLEASGTISMLGGGRITGDALVLKAGSGLDVTTTANSADMSVTGAGNLTVHESDALFVNHLATTNGAIDLTTGGAATLGEGAINAALGASDVTIHAAGAITGPLVGNNGADIIGAIVTLVTTGAGGTLGTSSANPLEINATAHLDVQTQDSSAFLTDVAGGLTIGAAKVGLGDFYLKALSDSLTASSQGDSIADIVAAHIDLAVTGAASQIGGGEGSEFEINGSDLTVKTEGGSAYLTDTAGGLAINTLDVGTGNLFLAAKGGALVDNTHGTANNIVATKLMLSATAGVGTASAPLTTTIAALEANGGSGGVHLVNSAAGLTIGGVTSALGGVTATGGDLVITTRSGLTVNEAVATAGGDLTLSALESAATGDDLTVNANLTAGRVTLLAGDNITLATGATVTAAGTVDLHGDYGDADAGVGSTLQLKGAIRANRLQITTGADADALNLVDAIVTSQSISTGDGSDKITIAAGSTLGTGTLDAGSGDNDLTVSSAVETVLSGDGSDNVRIFAPVTTLNAGGGHNTVTITAAVGTALTGDGADDFQVSGPVTLLNAGGGDNTITNTAAVGTMLTGDGVDVIHVNAPVTTLNAGGGANKLTIAGTVGTAISGSGADIIDISAQVGSLDADGGDNQINITAAVGTVLTGDGADVLHITAPVTSLNAGNGHNIVTIAAAVGTAVTGDGVDEVTVTAPVTSLDLGGGNNRLEFSAPIGTFHSGAGDDQLLMKAGGSVTVSADTGAGYDQFIYDHDGVGGDDYVGPVTVNLQTKTATGLTSFANIERIEATTSGNDHLIAADTTNAWHITGQNSGDIGGTGVFEFSGFENVTGGAADDAFHFGKTGRITGNLDGAGQTVRNSIDYQELNFDAASAVKLDGPAGGTASAIGGRFDHINEIIGDTDFAANNSFTGNDAANEWHFTATNGGNINGQFFFTGFGALTGGSGANKFAYADHVLPTKPVQGGQGNNTLDLSAWTSDLGWNITADNAGNVVTTVGTFEFSGMSNLLSGSGNDRFTFADDKILGQGLASPGSLSGGGGTDFIDLTHYTTRNLWSNTSATGTISTDKGAWSYTGNEQFHGSKTSTFLFDVVDYEGSISDVTLPAQLFPGQRGDVYLNVTNFGNDEALRQKINYSFYLSSDDKVDASDILIGTRDSSGISLYQGQTKVTFLTKTQVPLGTAAGHYHLLAVLDANNLVAEGDESNNVIVGGSIEVLPVTVDLAVGKTTSTLPAQVLPGARGTYTTTVKNLGNSPARGLSDVQFFLSRDGTFDAGDIALGGLQNVSLNLAPGASQTFTYSAAVPAGTAAGDYQVLALVGGKTVDPHLTTTSAMAETNMTNNLGTAPAATHVLTPYADLVGGVTQARLPALAIPNDKFTFSVPIKNIGNIPANGKIDVDFYLSTDDQLDLGTDVFLNSMHNVAIHLDPSGQAILTGSGVVPTSILGGTFHVLANIDSKNTIAEANDHNVVVSPETMEVVWRFGNFGARRGVHLVVPDAHGNMVDFSMKGQGSGDVLGGSDFTGVSLVGTNTKTQVRVMTQHGAITDLHDVTSTNPLNVFFAPKANLHGDFSVDGVLRHLRLRDVTDSTISIGSGVVTDRVVMKLGHVTDSSFQSMTPVKTLAVRDWQDTDQTADLIDLPWLRHLTAAGDFEADLVAHGLTSAHRSIDTINVKGIATSHLTLAGELGTMDVGGWVNGSLDGPDLGRLSVHGDLSDTRITLTDSAVKTSAWALTTLTVTGTAANTLIDVTGNVGTVQVGTWQGSTLAVGVGSGGDGTFFDGNETMTGGKLGAFKSKHYSDANGGAAFGVALSGLATTIQLDKDTMYTAAGLPLVSGDLHLTLMSPAV